MGKLVHHPDITTLKNSTEQLFAKLFFIYKLDKRFHLYHESKLVNSRNSSEVSLPDFEIVPKETTGHRYQGCFIEITFSSLKSPKKKRQRRAVMGWIQAHPDYFFLEYTQIVLEKNPALVEAIPLVFTGTLSAASLQGKIADTIYSR